MSFDPRLPDEQVNVTGSNPLVEAALLVAGVVGLVLLVVFAAGAALDWLAPKLPPAFEMRWLGDLGESEAGDLGAAGPDSEGATAAGQQTLEILLGRISAHWPENPYRFRVGILEIEEPNALALPGGWILVTRGLLENCTSENELAFVLGHEVGHFAQRDHLRGLGRGVALGLALAALGASGGVAGDLAGLAGALATRSFSREQEEGADAFGLGLVVAEYGHAAGATDFFEHAPEPASMLGKEVDSYLATHPLHEHRIEALRALARARGWPLDADLTPLGLFFPPADAGDAAAPDAGADGASADAVPGDAAPSAAAPVAPRDAAR